MKTLKQVKVAPYQVWRGRYANDFLVEVVSVDRKTNTVKGLGVQSRSIIDYKLDTWYDYYEFVVRPLYQIAGQIKRDWKPVWFGAVPYLEAMTAMDHITDNYGLDSGESVVQYFLGNAATWKGETAKRIKAELKALCQMVR